ncbi:hypothetical protein HK105_200295 [Polyrhizophydium stewartii]|uniref:Uncharacterized protein n=1 Tax=Polyrhizophydium stewartii TaxID=2732419 RepID=A0ABR4NL19_9FUNG
MEAVRRGDLDALRRLANDKSQDYVRGLRDLHANTILHTACHRGLGPLFEYAIQLGVDVNAVNAAGDTALILAAKRGDLGQIKRLVQINADVSKANDHGNTPLHYAAFWRHIDVAVFLASAAGAHIRTANIYDKTPIDKTGGTLQGTLKDMASDQEDITRKAQVRSKVKAMHLRSSATAPINWDTQASAIQILDPIARSHTATTYRGMWKGKMVAVKLPVLMSDLGEEDIRTITKEINAIRQPVLAPILAACIIPPDVCLLTEFTEQGTLSAFLHNPIVEMTPAHALKIAFDTIKALAFLHDLQPPMIHGNLKSHNILLSTDGNIRLVDYGMTACVFCARNVFRRAIFDVQWIAPEILAGSPTEDARPADIFAFGILLFEIVTRQHPYESTNAMAVGMQVLIENRRPEIPAYVPPALCWHADAAKRPPARTAANFVASPRFWTQRLCPAQKRPLRRRHGHAVAAKTSAASCPRFFWMSLLMKAATTTAAALALAALAAIVGPAAAQNISVTAPAGIITTQRSAPSEPIAFLGIPYASAARWAAPVAASPLPTPLDASALRPSCQQTCRELSTACPPKVSEDCLYINVWTPFVNVSSFQAATLPTGSSPALKPVLLVIHGGSFRFSGSGAEGFDARSLAPAIDALVVTFNYRLSIFGFPGVDLAGSGTANPGILDQALALNWTLKNIQAFGGDPSQITLLGQSAGALSAILHMTKPAFRSVFKRAVIMSAPSSSLRTPEMAVYDIAYIAVAAGCAQASVDSLPAKDMLAAISSCMRSRSPTELLRAVDRAHRSRAGPAQIDQPMAPVIDGVDIPSHPLDLLNNLFQQQGVSLMIGSTSNDSYALVKNAIGLTVPEALYNVMVNSLFPANPDDIRAIFSRSDATRSIPNWFGATVDLMSDYVFTCPALLLAANPATPTAPAQTAARVFSYFWDAPWNGPADNPNGQLCDGTACHTTDIASLFMLDDGISGTQPGSSLRGFVSQFIRTGSPSGATDGSIKLPEWPAIGVSSSPLPSMRFPPISASPYSPILSDSHPRMASCFVINKTEPFYKDADVPGVNKYFLPPAVFWTVWIVLGGIVLSQALLLMVGRLMHWRFTTHFDAMQLPANSADQVDFGGSDGDKGFSAVENKRRSILGPAYDASKPAPVSIECRNLSHTINGTQTLKKISFLCMPGSLNAILGPSGAGKTTLMSLISRRFEDAATAKNIYIGGKPLFRINATDLRSVLAYVPQHNPPYQGLTATEVLMYHARLVQLAPGTSEVEIAKRVKEILALLHLESCANVVIEDPLLNKQTLSGGQLKRLSVATAILKQPSVILLDEPTSGLDARASLELVSVLGHLSDHGYTVLVSIHQPRYEIFTLFSQVMLLAKGRLLYTGEPLECIQFAEMLQRTPLLSGSRLKASGSTVDMGASSSVLSPPSPSESLPSVHGAPSGDLATLGGLAGASSAVQNNPADVILDLAGALSDEEVSQAAAIGRKWRKEQLKTRSIRQFASPSFVSGTSITTAPGFGPTLAIGSRRLRSEAGASSAVDAGFMASVAASDAGTLASGQLLSSSASTLNTSFVGDHHEQHSEIDAASAARTSLWQRLDLYGRTRSFLMQVLVANARWWQKRPMRRKVTMPLITVIGTVILTAAERRQGSDLTSMGLHVKGLLISSVGLSALKNISISFDYFDDRDVYDYDLGLGTLRPLAFYVHRFVYETSMATLEGAFASLIGILMLGIDLSFERTGTIVTLLTLYYNAFVCMYLLIYSSRMSRPESRSATFCMQALFILTSGVWVRQGDAPLYNAIAWMQYINPTYWVSSSVTLRLPLVGLGECTLMRGDGACLSRVGDTIAEVARTNDLTPLIGVFAVFVICAAARAVQLGFLLRDAYMPWCDLSAARTMLGRSVKRGFSRSGHEQSGADGPEARSTTASLPEAPAIGTRPNSASNARASQSGPTSSSNRHSETDTPEIESVITIPVMADAPVSIPPVGVTKPDPVMLKGV